MELAELRALVTVVQAGSFTLAARRLHTHKAHISRLISGLEEKLNAKLLQRSTRALSVTEIGQAVYERAVGILHAVEDTERLTQSLSSEPTGLLRITASPDFGRLKVNNWINQYLTQYPKVRIEAEYTGRNIDLVHEGFDLAIRIGSLQDSNLIARHLGEIQYGLFASQAYLKQNPAPTTPDELTQHTHLQINGSRLGEDWLLSQDGKEARIKISSRLKINDTYGLCDATLKGLGIARLPLCLAGSRVITKELIPILPQWNLASAPIHAIFPSNRYLAPKVRSFIDFMVQNA